MAVGLSLPVVLRIGEHEAEIGTFTVDSADVDVRPVLADMVRRICADEMEQPTVDAE